MLFKRVTKRPMTLFFSTFSSALSSKSRSPLLTVDQPDSFLCIYRRCTAAPYPTSNHDDHYFSGQISSKALIQNCKCRNITPYQSTTGCNLCQIIHDAPPKSTSDSTLMSKKLSIKSKLRLSSLTFRFPDSLYVMYIEQTLPQSITLIFKLLSIITLSSFKSLWQILW